MRRCELGRRRRRRHPPSAPESARRIASDADRELNTLRCAGRGRNSEPPRLSAAHRRDLRHRRACGNAESSGCCRRAIRRPAPSASAAIRRAHHCALRRRRSRLHAARRFRRVAPAAQHLVPHAAVQRAGAVARAVGVAGRPRAPHSRERARRRRADDGVDRLSRGEHDQPPPPRHPRLGRARRHLCARPAGRAEGVRLPPRRDERHDADAVPPARRRLDVAAELWRDGRRAGRRGCRAGGRAVAAGGRVARRAAPGFEF